MEVEARGKRSLPILIEGLSGQGSDRNPAPCSRKLPDASHSIVAKHQRHLDIENDQVEILPACCFKRCLAIRNQRYAMPAVFKHGLDDELACRGILSHEDRQGTHG